MSTPQPPTPPQPGQPGGTPQPGQQPAAQGPHRDTATAILSVQQPPPNAPRGANPPQGTPAPGTPPQGGPQGAPQQQAPATPPGGGQPTGYQSHLPVRRTHLGHALASEWTKIRSVRSTIWTLGVMAGLTFGVSLLCGWLVGEEDDTVLPVLSWGFFGMMLGQLAVIALGVLVITSEYSTGMIRSTLTASPRRTRVLTAKAMVFFLVAFLGTLVTTGLSSVVLASMLEGKPPSPNASLLPKEAIVDGEVIASSGEWLGATVGVSLYVALLGLLSLAVGTLLRSAPGAITTMIGLVLVPFIISFFLFHESLHGLRDALQEYSFLNVLSTLYRLPIAPDADGTETGWPLLGLFAALTAVVLSAAYVRIATRDV